MTNLLLSVYFMKDMLMSKCSSQSNLVKNLWSVEWQEIRNIKIIFEGFSELLLPLYLKFLHKRPFLSRYFILNIFYNFKLIFKNIRQKSIPKYRKESNKIFFYFLTSSIFIVICKIASI
ncbi:hypothetical protein BpHYR1_018962 [Brachionus plicatilis]|uniref:Uncharacterized protein n=1 Tax=Brachionus plicatilis TaxID=10195 RepID=A0A3M7QMY9_BRAPC|nr:hypothetical protein BpHYR1_018962 [Brachionus plicatilis]